MCMNVFPACMYVHHGCAWCLQRPEEGVRLPGTEVTDGCELPHGSWKLNFSPALLHHFFKLEIAEANGPAVNTQAGGCGGILS